MLRVIFPVISLILLTTFIPAQHDASAVKASVRKKGAVYKKEVDGLIGVLRSTARQGEAAPAAKGVLGSDVLSTAKILVAMGRCHRHYHISDGPVVRPSLNYLIASRDAGGSFGDAQATAWVVAALKLMNADGYAEEIRECDSWLASKGVDESPFEASVHAVLGELHADRFPQDMANDAAAKAKGLMAKSAGLDRLSAADTLVALVSCQVANRLLDKNAGGDSSQHAWTESQQKAFAWLLNQQEGGIFSVTMPIPNDKGETVLKTFPDPALTGFGLMALQSKPRVKRTAAEQDTITAGLQWLLTQQNEDGTFGQQVTNYTTCVVVGALTRWKNPSTAAVLARAQKAILMFQNSEASGYERSDRDYGAIGYGSSQRGDLSNLHFSLEALRATGLPQDHEAMQKALVFLQRTQNLKSTNDFAGKVPHPDNEGEVLDVTSGDDGGATYYPGNSAAGYLVQPDGKAIARSYGSMTYALLKSYTLAGVSGDDPRVQAAVRWIQDNWTLMVNPGSDPALGEKVKYQGLFYYYMVLAQALDAADVKTVNVPKEAETGSDALKIEKIDWRQALRAHLAGMQHKDGSWVNGENGRWMENLPLLCTCYAMVALEHCK